MTRQSSSQSHISQSPSEGGQQRSAHHKAQRHHLVGKQRNTSFGKNLNKLNKAEKQAQQAQQVSENTARHHRRTQSGDLTSTQNSPQARPGIKRHASSGAVVRANNQAANLRKNHSSGHLSRQGHAKTALKSSKGENGPSKRALATPTRSRQASPEPHAAVHFDMPSDDEEDGEEGDGWTEESASQSPTTTRSNTRNNSVILEAQHKAAEINMERNRGDPSQQAGTPRETPNETMQTLPDRTQSNTRANGGSSYQHSRPPDADMITSRLLQRSASHHIAPQTSSVAATVQSATNRHNLLAHTAGSIGSTLVDTPGRDLVSRFMDGDGSAGTPRDGEYMASHATGNGEGADLDQSKRNKSMSNVSGGADTPSKTPQRSGATTPTNLPPSRTQQKLMLQRASSNIEPQKLVPVTLPRTGGPTFLQSSIHYDTHGEGRLDPRLLQQFNHVAVEYNVMRRFRNPVANALGRIYQIPAMSRKKGTSKTPSASGPTTGASSLSTSFVDGGHETDGASSRKSRVSFENDQGRSRTSRDEDDFVYKQSFDNEHARGRNEAEEICRRLWESAEVVEAD
jgi:hypothetical protein